MIIINSFNIWVGKIGFPNINSNHHRLSIIINKHTHNTKHKWEQSFQTSFPLSQTCEQRSWCSGWMQLARQQSSINSNLMNRSTQFQPLDSMFKKLTTRISSLQSGISGDNPSWEICGITTMKEEMQLYMFLIQVITKEYNSPNKLWMQ